MDARFSGAFEHLQQLLQTGPILRFPNFSIPFILETDASGMGLGAIFAQEQPSDGFAHPIAYASHSLKKHERNYGITELEGLGVVWAVGHFHTYLYGHKCTVYTDHEPLESLLNTPQPSGKLSVRALVGVLGNPDCPLSRSSCCHFIHQQCSSLSMQSHAGRSSWYISAN